MHRGKAFTLIELLVVIAVIALLMAILVPTLQRARRQAKAVVCQSRLRQWGTFFSMYTDDNNGRFFVRDSNFERYCQPISVMWPYYGDHNDLLLCPMATKPGQRPMTPPPPPGSIGGYLVAGSTFLAWGAWPMGAPGPVAYGSFSHNYWVRDLSQRQHWRTCLVKGADRVPVFYDCIVFYSKVENERADPPEYDGSPGFAAPIHGVCINRHEGGINSLFMDWSVRKVGLKELWTLKWHRQFDTAGPWTKAGGVKPEDWPQWMRRFKDY